MIPILEFREILQRFIPQDSRPVLIYSGLWYLGRSFSEPFSQLPGRLLDLVLDLVGTKRTLLMPTHSSGFKNGTINLDIEPSQTGALSETFRNAPGTLRTASSFFSFAAQGPDAQMLSDLRPKEDWGQGSVLEWVEENDAHLVMIGESWDACSLKHRAEWLSKVPYRYRKTFLGEMIKAGKRETLNECLFVRSLNPTVENVWGDLGPMFAAGGMQAVAFGGGQLAHMNAKALITQMQVRLADDAYAFTQYAGGGPPAELIGLIERKSERASD